MTKLLILFFGVAISLNAQNTNIFSGIIERNAFNLTEKKLIKILPPVTNILRRTVFLTGINSINNVKRVSLVIRGNGDDKFISLTNLQANSGIRVESIGSTNVLASVFGVHKLLSLKEDSLPTTITKMPSKVVLQADSKKLMQRSDKKRRDDERGKRGK